MSRPYKEKLEQLLRAYGMSEKRIKDTIVADAYLPHIEGTPIEVECKVISSTPLDDKCQTSLVKQGYPLR